MNDAEFGERAEQALEELEDRLNQASADMEMEVEAGEGTIKLLFEDPHAGTFVLSANPPAKQLWLSARTTSFKFNWSDERGGFVYEKTGEPIDQLLGRLISEQMGLAEAVSI
ncbi:MAG: iron donor protein CyaY [Terriglobia bacterium]